MDAVTPSLKTYKMFVGGQWVDAASNDVFESHNPYTGKPWALIPRAGAADADRAVRAAHKAFTGGDWPKMTASQRGGCCGGWAI
jgi:(Z)-2-((N-methylformamido)methylene)-5-hydroxybutyrolactone dehydrogenase